MKTLWNYSNYGNDLKLTRVDAANCTHPGPCDTDVELVMQKPYVKKQLAGLNPVTLAKELKEHGAWTEAELTDHNENLKRWVWISAGEIYERITP